ncbi:MAG TPA: hypothetical protein IAA58_10325 [Candidatus Gallacutalibacter stercoravium]|nr:hypothetical protein [Candidatus Gallacutalibacter stercoravium]
MPYSNLHDLISNSQSSRDFFLSLPIETQCELHRYNTFVHTAAQLHTVTGAIKQNQRFRLLSKWHSPNT